jgi:SRSO17 transposase
VASYAACFRARLHGQLAHCQQYIKGLFHACRSNVERMTERLPDSTYDALHHFISASNWDGPAVMGEVARRVQATLATLAGEQGLLLDECGWEKAGTKSVGVGRQYIGQGGQNQQRAGGRIGRAEPGQPGGLGGWAALPAQGLEQRCGALPPGAGATGRARLPQQAHAGGGPGGAPAGPGLGAGGLGRRGCGLWQLAGPAPGLATAGQAYVLGVGPGLQLFLADPTPAAAPAWSGRGRPPRRARPLGTALALPQVAAQVPAAAWQQVSYRPGKRGPLVREAVLVPVWRWKNGEQVAQALQLLISRELDGTQVKDSLCYCPPGTPALGVALALYRQMHRYWIERVFQEAKQQLGLHQNQTHSWPACQHHVALTMMALHLLLDPQLRGRETIPHLCFVSFKLILAQKLQNLLHQDKATVRQRAQANAPKHSRTHFP